MFSFLSHMTHEDIRSMASSIGWSLVVLGLGCLVTVKAFEYRTWKWVVWGVLCALICPLVALCEVASALTKIK